ncbi:Rz1-like lysis system protein LysC [Marilutibacter alkalisoli]|uniref:Rz1-like lysis system protein LysC n=1 Tax=Marilutibacter alkalisoli TaxID=2591633 RepID=UPI00141ED073|nr:hypothetical protein [Lysobacter alkalisoli]
MLLLVLAACRGTCPDIKPPEIVEVVVERYVPLPADLTRPCGDTAKRNNTVSEAVRLANARKADRDECNARMTQIRELGESP